MAKLIPGVNDLESLRPDLIKEWDYEKNTTLLPSMVSVGSTKKIWWKCSHGHEWEATISDRTRIKKETNCPFCAGKRLITGANDLKTLFPQIATEWDYDKNHPLRLEDAFAYSNKKVWWKCNKCRNSWQAVISSRTKGSGCPKCSPGEHTSFQEQAIYYYVSSVFPNTINGFMPEWENKKAEIDIFIPSLNLGIEYDGQKWHQNAIRDAAKTAWIYRNNCQLIRIREPNCPPLDDKSIKIQIPCFDSDNKYIENVINKIIEYINDTYGYNITIDCSISRDFQLILSRYEKYKHEHSLAVLFPAVVDDWDYDKNYPLTPEYLTAQTAKKAWWKCKICGGSSLQSIANRVSGVGCPYCAGKTVLKGFNDLASTNPVLANEWDYERNQELYPFDVTAGSSKKVWWRCKTCGFVWSASIHSRTSGVGCPACSNKTVWVGHNDLATLYPAISIEWNYEKNYPIKPQDVVSKSHKKVWWKCSSCGFEWQTGIVYRTSSNTGCPSCAKKKLSIHAQKQNLVNGVSDLASQYPQLAVEWDNEKNKDLTPDSVSVGSGYKVWWKCSICGYEWQAVIQSRTNGSGCPACRRKKMSIWAQTKGLMVGKNDLATTDAQLLIEWDYYKNTDIDPSRVTRGSGRKVWWICSNCGHSWQTKIIHRANGSGCPVCSRRKKCYG